MMRVCPHTEIHQVLLHKYTLIHTVHMQHKQNLHGHQTCWAKQPRAKSGRCFFFLLLFFLEVITEYREKRLKSPDFGSQLGRRDWKKKMILWLLPPTYLTSTQTLTHHLLLSFSYLSSLRWVSTARQRGNIWDLSRSVHTVMQHTHSQLQTCLVWLSGGKILLQWETRQGAESFLPSVVLFFFLR